VLQLYNLLDKFICMKIKQMQQLKTQFLSSTNILKSYERKHVSMYWKWMQDSSIRKIRGLSVISRAQVVQQQKMCHCSTTQFIFLIADPEIKRAVGDVRLFLQPASYVGAPRVGELWVMIAVKKSRRKGLAFKAVKLMMKFGREYLGVRKFWAHISGSNTESLALFENRLGFRRVEVVSGYWKLESSEFGEFFEKYEGPPEIDLADILKWGQKRSRDNSKANPNSRR